MAGKRVRSDTNFQPKKKKCAQRSFVADDDDDDDRISQLPDDIIVDILSFLSLNESARTSVLSSRWINLWKHVRSLDFDSESVSSLKSKRHKYVQWLNSILESHKSFTLKDFRIRFCFDGSESNSVVTQWLKFAFSRQVQRLELDFPNCNSSNGGYYCFPEDQFLASSSSMQLFECKSLKALTFKNVNVSGGAIELFLRNCPLLEQLIVHSPGKSISKLDICGSSLVLKHLEIVQFPGLESLRIAAPTLTSLRFTSLKGVSLENVPMLVDVSVSLEGNSISVKSLLSVLCCCISRLETLNLSLLRCHVRREIDELSNSSEMPKNLKKLVIEYDSCDDESLIRLASLTRASPYLEEFVLKNKWFKSWMKRKRVDDDNDDDDDVIIRFRQHHLRVFKSCGYQGRPSARYLVHYMLKNSVVLENAKRNLQPQLPQHVKLVIP